MLPIGKALGRIPSGVFILTAAHAGKRGAMLASWVMQAPVPSSITDPDPPGGVPMLPDALGWLDAKLIDTFAYAADHELIIAQVTAGALLRDGLAFNHQRGNGFHY